MIQSLIKKFQLHMLVAAYESLCVAVEVVQQTSRSQTGITDKLTIESFWSRFATTNEAPKRLS
jgi:hypothetical protein